MPSVCGRPIALESARAIVGARLDFELPAGALPFLVLTLQAERTQCRFVVPAHADGVFDCYVSTRVAGACVFSIQADIDRLSLLVAPVGSFNVPSDVEQRLLALEASDEATDAMAEATSQAALRLAHVAAVPSLLSGTAVERVELVAIGLTNETAGAVG